MDPARRPLKILTTSSVFRVNVDAVIGLLDMAVAMAADAETSDVGHFGPEEEHASNLRKGDVKLNHGMDGETTTVLSLMTPDTTLMATIMDVHDPRNQPFWPDASTPETMRTSSTAMARTVSDALRRVATRPSGVSNVIRRDKPVHAKCVDRLRSIACWSAQSDERIDPTAGMTVRAPTPWSPPLCDALRTSEWMEERNDALARGSADAIWGRLPALLEMELGVISPDSPGERFRRPTRTAWSVTLKPVGQVWHGERDPMELLRLLSKVPLRA